ncbi:MAG: class F420-dependent oxidoreductase [Ilumatobacteraceae bacterium]|nr:class F420-dependent oxidoreductase [Ilumatobacteraceae bacterium]
MKLGVFGLNSKSTIGPAATARLAVQAEQLGYESWWAGEHVVLPSPRVPPAPMNPEDPILDPIVHLSFVAAVTQRLLLGSGIIILPQRNPLVLAKQIATLDTLSGGRFQFGVGVGYLEPELNAIGVTLAERASRTDDYLGAMRAIWYDTAPVSFSGPHTSFSGLDANPRPQGTIPIVVGGTTPGAHKRAVEQGHGWYGFFLTPEQSAAQVQALAAARPRFDRPAELGELEISITPPRPLTAESLAAYADAGVHRLIVYPLPVEDEAAIGEYLESHAALVR